MLLSLDGRRVYFDLAGPQSAPTVCFTHSLNSDGGMWVEQLVPLLAAGYRVLRLDMRGHGGSAPVDGDYTMDALAADVKGALDVLDIKKVHYIGLSIGGMIGQGFALAYPDRLLSLTLCDTQPSTPPGSAATWEERKATVRTKGLAALADSTMERWFTDEFRKVNPTRWREIRDTISGTTPAGSAGCMAAIQNFNYEDRLATIKTADAGDLRRRGSRHATRPQQADRLQGFPAAATKASPRRAICPMSNGPSSSIASMMAFLAANR